MRPILRAAAALIPLAAILIALPAAAAPATTGVHAPGPLLREAVAALPVALEDRTGYKRTAFRHWIDANRDGCNTRDEVLLEEAHIAPQVEPRCEIVGGSWYSYYTDTVVTDARALDIDHLVPLAEAWDSGASTWTPKRRQDYANDLTAPHHLVAVTARSNRSKADKDPSQWLPPYQPARCRYVTEWVSVKIRWGLTVDTAEQATLSELVADCPNVPLPTPADDSTR
ncbi:HNH endonuclease family protein [Micrococcus luteus]|uniref:HNH endonuclease family protein n=1 Tax=Micrococcus luteus TaxID=1270 RepID=UPI00332EB4F4